MKNRVLNEHLICQDQFSKMYNSLRFVFHNNICKCEHICFIVYSFFSSSLSYSSLILLNRYSFSLLDVILRCSCTVDLVCYGRVRSYPSQINSTTMQTACLIQIVLLRSSMRRQITKCLAPQSSSSVDYRSLLVQTRVGLRLQRCLSLEPRCRGGLSHALDAGASLDMLLHCQTDSASQTHVQALLDGCQNECDARHMRSCARHSNVDLDFLLDIHHDLDWNSEAEIQHPSSEQNLLQIRSPNFDLHVQIQMLKCQMS